MKKISLLMLMFLPLMIDASVKIDGLYYNLDLDTKKASLTYYSTVSSKNKIAYYGNVTIPESIIYKDVTYKVTYISDRTFRECSDLISVTIPKSVTAIGANAFEGCKALESVYITDIAAWYNIDFASLLSNPFCFAKHLYIDGEEVTNIIIPNSVRTIGNYTFYGMNNLISITIPNSITSIGISAFSGCSSLTSVTIPNSVTSIGNSAFSGCSGLTSITIPNSVTSIGEYTFSSCSSLTYITIPNSVTSIGDKAFAHCSSLKSIIIPNSVNELGDDVFERCSNLESVKISKSIKKLNSSVFQDCTSLTSVTIPENVIDLGGTGTFGKCTGLTTVVIPKSVERIGFSVFDGCSNLKDIFCYAETPPSTTSSAFLVSKQGYSKKQFKADIVIHVPESSVNAYKEAHPWSQFKSIVSMPPVVVENIAINETNFPDESFRNWVLSQSYGNDGILTEEEIASVTEISVKEEIIQDLEGIEHFTALRALICWGNELTYLDLSKNTELEELYCSNNKLSWLDLSKNTELISLECYHNKITTLDVSKNTKLKVLNCGDNWLTSLDVSACKAMTYLSCSDNQLTSLDMSKNIALTNLECSNNLLTSFDLSKNMELKDLSCGDNRLTSLDLLRNTELTTLYCYKNQIKDAEMDALVESLPTVSDGKIKVIYNEDEGNVMTTTQVAAAKAKGWTPYYTEGRLDEYGDVIWLDYAGSKPVVDGIAINETNFPDDNFRNWVLSQSYGNDGILTEEEIASVTHISITDENIQDLEGIEYFTELRGLVCWGNELTNLDLSKNTELEELYCSNNNLTSLDLSKNTALTNLECYDNQLTSLDISKNTALYALDCSQNGLTSLDVSGCTALEYLYCYSNLLTSLNISKNTALRSLDCWSNQLTSLDVSKNMVLTDLSCESNQISSLNVSKNTELTTLHCYQNRIKGAEMDALVESLPTVSDGEMMVIYYEDEGNVMTTTQVATAKDKGWTPYYTKGELDEYDDVIWLEYAGRNDDVLRGDVNGDGEVNVDDATFVTNIILGTEETTEAADVNLDGIVSMPDVMYIINYIKNGKFPDDGKETMLKTPLTLEAIVDGAILFKNAATGIVTYKIDDGVAQIIDAGTSKEIPVSAGQKVAFYGDNETYSIGTTEKSRIISSVDCYVYGNIMSLINSTDFASATTLTGEKTFEGLFSGAAKLKNHPSKQLKLPATTLTKYCYRYMFSHCAHLRLAPALPATTLAEGCYYSMFEECTNLVSAPDLPATILAGHCYWWMFYNCSSLTYVNCLATDIGAYGCTEGWLKGVAASGTFVKASGMNGWTSGDSGIPAGWTVQ